MNNTDKENLIKSLQNIIDSGWGSVEIDSGTVEDILALLKEQEAVEPKCQIIFDVPYYFCGSCKTMLNMYAVKAKYCSNCARRVKWK